MSEKIAAENDTDVELKELLNGQTGKLSWQELQRHFARGSVIIVAAELDMIQVGIKIIEDDKQQVEAWLNSGQMTRATDDHARNWQAKEPHPEFWSTVVAPWVLIQEFREQ
ncbi:MAG: DUF2288 domain-containing protein [Gammaproteobacteria bacterium]|nr:DUF2288 domain-containing protein [Gammaproteobacteria bacterium]